MVRRASERRQQRQQVLDRHQHRDGHVQAVGDRAVGRLDREHLTLLVAQLDGRAGGDGVEVADLSFVRQLCVRFPHVKFLLTVLSSDNQHELCVLQPLPLPRPNPNLAPDAGP